MPGELSRRSALRGVSIVAPAAVVGYLVARSSDAAQAKGPGTAANEYGAERTGGGRRLAGLDQIPTGGGLILSDQQIVLTKSASGAVHAFSAICTHQGCPVNTVADGTIDCPCHGSRFDADTGDVVAGPAPRPLPPIPVTVQDDGIYTA